MDALRARCGASRSKGRVVGVLDSIDVDVLALGTPEEVRAAVRRTTGSGSSIPSYVPVRNHLTTLDEARPCASIAT